MSAKQNNRNLYWIEKPLNLIITIVGAAGTVFYAGYYIGDFKKNLEQQVSDLKKGQECNERVAAEKEKCSEYRRLVEDEKLADLQKTVQDLSEIKRANKNEK